MHSVQFNCSAVSDSLRPHRLQHTRLPCPSPAPGTYSNSSPSSQWMTSKICLYILENFSRRGTIDNAASSVQFSSIAQLCPTLCDPMNHSTPGLPVHHHLPQFTQTHVHWVSDAIQPFHPRLSPSPPAPNPSQHQIFFQWVSSSHEVAEVLEFQL